MARPWRRRDAAAVLVVDDDAALAEMLTIVLRNEGFEPRVVTRGDEALAAFRDFARPGAARPDAARQGRHRRVPGDPGESGVPIVMLTAKSDTVDVVVGLESGRRRLRRQAVQAQGARRPDPGAGAPLRGADAPRSLDDRRPDASTSPGHAVTRDGERDRADPAGVRPAGLPGPQARGRCSPARCCSSRSGATGTPPTPGWSTCTCSGCAPRSSTTRRTPRSW